MSPQRQSRLVRGLEATAIVFERWWLEGLIGKVPFILLLRALFVRQHRLGYLKHLLDTRRKVSSHFISFCNEIHLSQLLAQRCYSTVSVVFAVVVMSEARIGFLEIIQLMLGWNSASRYLVVFGRRIGTQAFFLLKWRPRCIVTGEVCILRVLLPPL